MLQELCRILGVCIDKEWVGNNSQRYIITQGAILEWSEKDPSDVDDYSSWVEVTPQTYRDIVIGKIKPQHVYTTISFEEVPDSWLDRCSGDGHERDIDRHGNKVYIDSGNIVQEEGYRPCAKCGEFPTVKGDDACMSNLGRVINACCGHGKNKGYIMFDDGRIVEGNFTVKNIWK